MTGSCTDNQICDIFFSRGEARKISQKVTLIRHCNTTLQYDTACEQASTLDQAAHASQTYPISPGEISSANLARLRGHVDPKHRVQSKRFSAGDRAHEKHCVGLSLPLPKPFQVAANRVTS